MAVGVGGAVWGAKVGGEGGKLPRDILLPMPAEVAALWKDLRAFCSRESFNSLSSASLEGNKTQVVVSGAHNNTFFYDILHFLIIVI